jgi:hypothetical protein
MNLRGEFPLFSRLQLAVQLFRRAGGDLERRLTLQTEAAAVLSAKLIPDHAHIVLRWIPQPKLDFVVANLDAREFAVRIIYGRAGPILGVEIQVHRRRAEHDR